MNFCGRRLSQSTRKAMDHNQQKAGPHLQARSGIRKITAGLLAAEALAADVQKNEQPMPGKNELYRAVRFLTLEGRLSLQNANMLDVLIGFCGTLAEGHPVIFASNRALADRVGIKERALRTRLANLGALRLICHVDRADRRRGVGKNPVTGERIYYGISLSPLIAQLDEINARADSYEQACKEARAARRAITAGTTRIQGLYNLAIELGGSEPEWRGRRDMAEDIHDLAKACDDRDDLEAYADVIRQAQSDAEIAVRELSVDQSGEIAAYPAKRLPPITKNKSITDKSEHCPDITKSANARTTNEPEQKQDHCEAQTSHRITATHTETRPGKKKQAAIARIINSELTRYHIDPPMICQLSETIRAFIDLHSLDNPTWTDCANAADIGRNCIGLSDYGWRKTIEALGPKGAIAALAYATAETSGVVNPPAYIHNLAQLAQDGAALDLGRKLRKVARHQSAHKDQRRPN